MHDRRILQRVVICLLLFGGAGCNKSGGGRGVTSSGGTSGTATGGAGEAAGGAPGTGGTTGPIATGGTVAGSGGTTPGSGGTSEGGSGGSEVAATGGAAGGPSDAGMPPPLVDAFAATARQIAADYLAWGRVDDELRWAPFLCRIPLPGIARPSESNDATTHGKKLYSVFAKNHDAYPNGPQTDQVVVKQSWTAELVGPGAPSFISSLPGMAPFPSDGGDHFYPYANGDGGVYRAADFAGLYIMYKLDPGTPDTDEGWVYATITPDGQVTAAGRVESCMGCHEVATHERLFGVPLSPTLSN